jgi:hypothetical protein
MRLEIGMLSFGTYDEWLCRPMHPTQLRALPAAEKAERRRAQHREFQRVARSRLPPPPTS